MGFGVPGHADQLNPDLIQKWNDTIRAAYDRLSGLHTRFFSLEPQDIGTPVPATVKWFGDPAEPVFCLNDETARELSDWGVKGRQALHNEYCEYCTIYRLDASGRPRPKRVQVTTELREYWVCIAKHDPEALRTMMAQVLGFQPNWEDVYGVADPTGLTLEQREVTFASLVAGHGNHRHLKVVGVPAQPTGRLNTENALFMTHPINGLDDLIYIVLFGARPYARRDENGPQPASREDIFRTEGVEHLACRHADPAAAMGAYGAAFEGRSIAFADPLGMYILTFARDVFFYQNETVPDTWVRWSRGQQGTYQRLEFGPGDDEPAFLDDILVAVGAEQQPLTGGFQLVQHLEVGPSVIAGSTTSVGDDEYRIVDQSRDPIQCHKAGICDSIRTLEAEYDDAHRLVRVAPRTMGIRG